ncbi:MAG: hypothetical protein CSA35_02820 [Dethiosulfovibrio peptidovorans]|nr:MAG: hypothetical protein CSA35_02820 [Dethiosulfovibrio peptidovorans]
MGIYVKYLFGKQEHHEILLDFINDAVFDEDDRRFTKLMQINTELTPEGQNQKLCRLDRVAELDNGVTVDIEIQIVNEHDFNKRLPYYWAMSHGSKTSTA